MLPARARSSVGQSTGVHPALPGRHDREAVRPRWRASGDRGESPAQAATDRPAPCSPACAEPDAERPAALRIGVALPQSRANPKGRHRRAPFDASGVSSGVGASQVPPTVRVEPVPAAARTEGPSHALIHAIVELKSRNARFGCPRIARIITQTFGVDIDMVGAHRDISVPIMIRCLRRTVGRRTFGFWRSTKSRPCLMCPVTPLRGASDRHDAARISQPGAVLECPVILNGSLPTSRSTTTPHAATRHWRATRY